MLMTETFHMPLFHNTVSSFIIYDKNVRVIFSRKLTNNKPMIKEIVHHYTFAKQDETVEYTM